MAGQTTCRSERKAPVNGRRGFKRSSKTQASEQRISLTGQLKVYLCDAKKGSVAIMMGLSMPVIVGFCALGAEIIFWQFSQRTLQGAADAAAFSATAQLAQGRDSTAIDTAGGNAAYASGLDPARANAPAISYPPGTGAFAGNARAVEVNLTDNLPRLFTKIFFNTDTVQIRARAVASVAGGRPSCILALSKTAGRAVSFSGSSELELDGCDIASNSVADDAIDFTGATDVTAECASAVGGVDGENGSLTLTDCAAVFEGTRTFPDPYGHLATPAVGACDGGLKSDLNVSPGTDRTVNPGTVCSSGGGGPNVSIKGDIDFNPGVYVFDGVNLNINSTATLRGEDVMFFFTGGTTININGGADIELVASDDPLDPYQGLLFFADPADAGLDHVLNGNSSTSFTGALYFPTANVQFSGTNDANPNACTLLVADTVEFTGSSFFASDCTSLGISAAETAQVVLIVE